MIYTVTCNPSLDYVVDVPDFTAGGLNRTASEHIFAGGKGINVSWVLHDLGIDTCALGFTAGFTGAEIERQVRNQGIKADFIRVPETQGLSRINMKMRSSRCGGGAGAGVSADAGEPAAVAGASAAAGATVATCETEINGMGPRITECDIAELRCRLDAVTADDMVVLAGNIPKSLPDTLYCDLLKSLGERGVPVVVDASGEQLRSVLQYRPFLVKPNDNELGGLFDVKIQGRDQALEYARRLQQLGPRNVLVSLGADGAVFVGEDGSTFYRPAPEITVVNSTGAGDSMVAGFLAGWLQTGSFETAFSWGIASGSTCAASEGLPSQAELRAAGCNL